MIISNHPARRLIVFVFFAKAIITITKIRILDPIVAMRSGTNIVLKGRGVMTELTPNTRKMLKILEPIALPIAIPACFLRAATMLVTSSGNDVATAITVTPIIASLSPIKRDISIAPSTIHLPPKYSPPIPKMINIIDLSTGISGILIDSLSSSSLLIAKE